MRRLLTFEEAARRLNVKPRTVRRLVARGLLRAVRITAKIVRIPWPQRFLPRP